jgi:hypothetical protein
VLRSRVLDIGRRSQLLGQTDSNLLEYLVYEFIKSNVEENVGNVPGLETRYTKRRKHLPDVARSVRVAYNGV